jgi:hypothetical protein
MRDRETNVFAAHLSHVDQPEIQVLRLGKTEALYEQAAGLARQLDRYSYGPSVRFADAEIDQARAAGAVIEFERGWPLVVDRRLYRELCKQAIARTVTELETQVAERDQERADARCEQAAGRVQDPLAETRRESNRQLRELARQAHGVNLDLGAQLLDGLSTVDPGSMDIARSFVQGGLWEVSSAAAAAARRSRDLLRFPLLRRSLPAELRARLGGGWSGRALQRLDRHS